MTCINERTSPLGLSATHSTNGWCSRCYQWMTLRIWCLRFYELPSPVDHAQDMVLKMVLRYYELPSPVDHAQDIISYRLPSPMFSSPGDDNYTGWAKLQQLPAGWGIWFGISVHIQYRDQFLHKLAEHFVYKLFCIELTIASNCLHYEQSACFLSLCSPESFC